MYSIIKLILYFGVWRDFLKIQKIGIYGVWDAVIFGWGIFIAFIAYYPFKAKERWAWYCIASVFVVWFVIDTVVSVYYRVGFNVSINITLLWFALLPLILTRKHFRES